jgi:hypothetical protein
MRYQEFARRSNLEDVCWSSPVAICHYTCAQAGVLHAQCLDVRRKPEERFGLVADDLIPELLGGGDD